MATAFAATTVTAPIVVAPKLKYAMYDLQLPSSWPVAGQAWDLTDHFTKIYGFTVLSGDAYTDWETTIECTGPGYDTAISSSNVLITCHWGGGAGAALDATADTTDLSGVANACVIVWGQ